METGTSVSRHVLVQMEKRISSTTPTKKEMDWQSTWSQERRRSSTKGQKYMPHPMADRKNSERYQKFRRYVRKVEVRIIVNGKPTVYIHSANIWVDSSCGRSFCIIYIHWNYVSYYSLLFILSIVMSSRYQTGSVLSHFIDKLVSSEYMFVTSVSRLFSPTHHTKPVFWISKYLFQCIRSQSSRLFRYQIIYPIYSL